MSRSSSPGNLFCAGDEFAESELNSERAKRTALGLDGAAPKFFRSQAHIGIDSFKKSRSSSLGRVFSDEFPESEESESETWTALGSDGAAPALRSSFDSPFDSLGFPIKKPTARVAERAPPPARLLRGPRPEPASLGATFHIL